MNLISQTEVVEKGGESSALGGWRLNHRLPVLDGLRALAIIPVVLGHTFYTHIPGGVIGVYLFFVLSGFLITGLLVDEYAVTGRISLRLFYMRRICRLIPAMVALLFLDLLLRRFYPSTCAFSWLKTSAIVIADISNFFRIKLCMMGHTWSLSVEEQFYLFWPLVLMFLLRGNRRALVLGVPALLIAGSAILRVWLFPRTNLIDVSAFTPALLDIILFGSLAALIARRPVGLRIASWASAWRVPEVVVVAMFSWFIFVDEKRFALHPEMATGMAFGFALLILCMTFQPRKTRLAGLLESEVFQWLGKRSYGIYLYHFPIMWALEWLRVRGDVMNLCWVTLLRVALSFLVADLSYRFLEMPFLKLKTHFDARKAVLKGFP